MFQEIVQLFVLTIVNPHDYGPTPLGLGHIPDQLCEHFNFATLQ